MHPQGKRIVSKKECRPAEKLEIVVTGKINFYKSSFL